MPRNRTRGLWGLDISPKVLRPVRGRAAVLGRYALIKPGDCNRPDTRYVASNGEAVNTEWAGGYAIFQLSAEVRSLTDVEYEIEPAVAVLARISYPHQQVALE